MRNNTINIVIVGVGGQGTLLASKILAQLAVINGYSIKVSEVHGMAQRGGSVITHVRLGNQVNAPLVAAGEADYLLAFEPLEAARALSYLKPDGHLIVNTQRISPMSVLSGKVQYPEDAYQSLLKEKQSVQAIDAYTPAVDAGSFKAVNIVLLGVLSNELTFSEEDWLQAIKACVPQKTLETNNKAFYAGQSIE